MTVASPAIAVPATAYAGFWRRAVALFVDPFILIAVTLPIRLVEPIAIITGADIATVIGQALGAAAIVGLIWWLYYAGFESSRWQATPGKRVIGIRVTDAAGARVSFARASGRFFAKILSGLICGIGYLLAAFTARKQALHDLIAGTLVVR